ncbi:PucR family transcriptional regulator ligand-binding domain-containing protein [Bacillaceae bacterium S4-13-58]
MAITLRQALKIGGLRKCKVVAGSKGLDRSLTYVTIMEVPDIVKWLKGEELLLTSLYPIKDDEIAVTNLVKDLHKKGTSALAIKPHRFVDDIPEIILREAEKFDFPIIEIPEEVSYLDILSPVMNAIFDKKVVIQDDLEQAYRLLDEIKLSNGGIKHLKDTLKHLIKYDITIDSFIPYLNVPAPDIDILPISDDQKNELEIIQRPIRLYRWNKVEGKKQECIVAPVFIEGRLFGAISCVGVENDFLEVDLAILERASTVLSLQFMRDKAKYELEQQFKTDFFRELLYSQVQHEETILDKGKMFGFDLQKNYLFLYIEINTEEIGMNYYAELVNKLEFFCSQLENGIIIGTVQNGLYILYPSINKSKDRLRRDIDLISKEIAKESLVVTIGIGRAASNISEIREGFEQSRQAVLLGKNLFKEKNIIFYEDLGVYRLLAEIKNTTELQKFHEESMGSLIEYDKHHDLDLIHSLIVYFENNESMSKTAKALFIHINTMKYRIQRIKMLTNLDPKNSEDKLILQIGLKIHNFIQNDYRFR